MDYDEYREVINGIGDYIQEKLEIYDYTGEKLAELINGIIEKINEKDGEQ